MSANLTTDLNVTMNVTQSSNCSIPGSSIAAKIGLTFAYCLILVVSLAGNSLIAIIVYKTKPMRKPINYFIVNMAISDLLFPVFVLPFVLIELYDGFGVFIGRLGQTSCKVRKFLLYFSCCVSVVSLVLITIERFVAVVFPLRAPLFSSKMCYFAMVVTWLLSIALCFPVLFSYKPDEHTTKMKCDWLWEDTVVSYYCYALPIVGCGICFFFLTILYSIILFKLKSQKTPGEQSVRTEVKRVRMRRNVLMMVWAIVIGFLLCWGPYSVLSFVNVFVWDNLTSISCQFRPYWSTVGFLVFANCALNLCICFTFSGNYRQALKGLLRCQGKYQS